LRIPHGFNLCIRSGGLVNPTIHPKFALCFSASGDAHLAKIRAISYDASMNKGWSEALQTSEDPTMHIYSHTYPPGTDSSVQVHNEAAAGLNAIRAVELLVDLSDSIIILRNDCSGALLPRQGQHHLSYSSRLCNGNCKICAVGFNPI
jgi:hypothetical protein